MTMTRRQIDSILAPDLLPADRVPGLAMRVCETYVKRRLFVFEDGTVKALATMYRATLRQIRIAANDAAAAQGLGALERTPAGRQWRDTMTDITRRQLDVLQSEVKGLIVRRATVAFYAGYYGRAWLLSSVTRPEVQVNAPHVDIGGAVRRAFSEQVGELDLLKSVWFDDAIEEFTRSLSLETEIMFSKLRQSMNEGLRTGETIPQFMGRVAKVMGIGPEGTDEYSAAFARLSSTARSYVINASNQGAMALYEENSDLVLAGEHLTARDERVCPICRAMDGDLYDIGDRFLPPQNTHPNCRCSVLPVLVDSTAVNENVRPALTFAQYIALMGITAILTEYMAGRGETERV